jgi:hypothetical protein
LPQHAPGEQHIRRVDHAEIEALDLGFDPARHHLLRQGNHHLGGVLAGAARKIERRHGETRQVRSGGTGQLEHLTAAFEIGKVSPATAHTHDGVGMVPPDTEDHFLVDLGSIGGVPLPVASMQMHDCDPQLERLAGILDYLGRRDRDVRRHCLGRDHPSRAEVDDQLRVRRQGVGEPA